MSYYDELKDRNLIRLLAGKLKTGELSLRGSDNKFIANLNVDWNSVWSHNKPNYLINCYLWKDITFHEIAEKHLPKPFVPVGCQDCYKLVVKPRTLKQLFELETLQVRLGLSSKCGIELRKEVFGNYGGYFYNRGLGNGLDCYRVVFEAMTQNPVLLPLLEEVDENGIPTRCILKRGCTEMESAVGPSDKWTLTKAQVDFEVRLQQHFCNDLPALSQSEMAKDEVHHKWIDRAHDIGDETVVEYNDGKPLYPPYVTYHHMAHQKKEGDETDA